MKNGWYEVVNTNSTATEIEYHMVIDGCCDYGAGEEVARMIAWGYTFAPAVVMSAYAFNKNMQDAYNIGKHGPIECDLEDLLYEAQP